MKQSKFYQIKNVTEHEYTLVGCDGSVITLPIQEVDKTASVFTIKDAKDGDVLYLQKDGKEHIIIYKGVIKERFRAFVSAYCAYNGIVDAFCFADVSRYVDIAYGGIMPATKEQRDTLMKAMADAGYEWDAEHKQLKKIEQKPAETEKGTNGNDREIPNSAWSEEDEEMLENIICDINTARQYVYVKSKCDEEIDWLNSIKDRVQPRQEWGEEDKRIIDNLVSQLGNLYARKLIKEETKDKYVNWLKSLKPQSTWKPSDEQMESLTSACDGKVLWLDYLKSLYQDLKKLKG